MCLSVEDRECLWLWAQRPGPHPGEGEVQTCYSKCPPRRWAFLLLEQVRWCEHPLGPGETHICPRAICLPSKWRQIVLREGRGTKLRKQGRPGQGGSAGWSTVSYTEMSWVRFRVRAVIPRLWVQASVGAGMRGNKSMFLSFSLSLSFLSL